MPECTFSSDHSNCQCIACNTNDNSFRTDDILCRRKRNADIECRFKLPVVKRSDNTDHKCNGIGKLYGKSNQCERVPEPAIGSDISNSLCITLSTNHHCLGTDYLLRRRECHTDIECGDELPVVNRSDLTKHKCKYIRKLQCKSYQFERMP
jgi:hypothetical protein